MAPLPVVLMEARQRSRGRSPSRRRCLLRGALLWAGAACFLLFGSPASPLSASEAAAPLGFAMPRGVAAEAGGLKALTSSVARSALPELQLEPSTFEAAAAAAAVECQSQLASLQVVQDLDPMSIIMAPSLSGQACGGVPH
mmetsp:Transcript_16019/g.37786  ORF Transcript_16019/g.37786 Transcript_16019/m.37786 type:complete len:141 (-) Transcript_16019:291-713(-)